MIRVMKRGEQYINIPFEPYNLKMIEKGDLMVNQYCWIILTFMMFL